MKIALTGASGLVGRFLHAGLRKAGHQVVTLGRSGADIAFDLASAPPRLTGIDALVHAGFAHILGRYRGGEGDDPEGFKRLNLDGSLRLFESAASDGVTRLAFLSTRAVYGAYPPGTTLTEDLPPRPDTLYAEVKHRVEAALPRLAPHTLTLRPTGVYGPGPAHKWQQLFQDFIAGRPVAPRVATEIHGADLAGALTLALPREGAQLYNVSDLILDRHDLLEKVAALAGCTHPPPPRAEASTVSAMDCARLKGIGWRPGGWPLLRSALPEMLRPTVAI